MSTLVKVHALAGMEIFGYVITLCGRQALSCLVSPQSGPVTCARCASLLVQEAGV